MVISAMGCPVSVYSMPRIGSTLNPIMRTHFRPWTVQARPAHAATGTITSCAVMMHADM